MIDDLGNELGDLGLSLDSKFEADGIAALFCGWGCYWTGCHGAGNSIHGCNGAPCYNGTANLNPQPACAYGTSNYDNTVT